MGKQLGLIIGASLLLGGCGGFSVPMPWGERDSGEVTVNWFCTKLESGGQHCEKRRMRNGQPVDDEVYETLVIPEGKALPVPQEAAPKPQSLHSAIPWDRDAQMTVNPIEDTGASLAIENTGPAPRQPKDSVDLWKKLHGGKNPKAN